MGDVITLCEEILENDTFGSIIVPGRENNINNSPPKKIINKKKININKKTKIETSTNTEPSLNKPVDELNAKINRLENENKILKDENKKLLNEIEEYKKYKEIEYNNDKKMKIIFLFKKSENLKFSDKREEIEAFRFEMFIEVKLRLLQIKNLGPCDIKNYYYNSKEINDWYTLEDLHMNDIDYVVCEY